MNTHTEIVEKALDDDNEAWEAIVREHQEPVFRLSYLLLGDPDDAADNVQETFLRARRYFQRYDPARPLQPWLLSITANLAHNRRRSAARYFAAVARWARTKNESPGPEHQAFHATEQERLWQAVRRLTEKDQRIIYLRFFLELNVAETAQSLDIAPGTVKSRLSRALSKLRGVIQAEFPDLEGNL